MRLRHLLTATTFALLTACGGGGDGGSTPTTPGGATQTLSTIRVSNAALSLAAGTSAGVTVAALDAAGRTIASATGYTYTSSTPAVAEVQANGSILALSAGTSTITVSLSRDGVTATATTTVTVTGTLPVAASVTAGNDNTFAPPTVVIARNGSVTYAFGSNTHNVGFRASAGAPPNIGNTASSTVARAFAVAGDYTYDCSLHAGMTGQVIVR